MKKKLSLLLRFYDGIRFPAVLLFCMILSAELFLAFLIGTYQYCTYKETLLKQIPGAAHMIYAMDTNPPPKDAGAVQSVLQMGAVKEVYSKRLFSGGDIQYNGWNATVALINPEMLRDYPLFTGAAEFTATGIADGKLQCIAAGSLSEQVSLRQEVTVTWNGQPLETVIVGKLEEPGYLLAYKNSGSNVTVDDILQPAYASLLLKDTPEVREALQSEGFLQSHFYIVFHENAALEEKNEVFTYLGEHGHLYTTYDDILYHSYEVSKERIQQVIPLPAYLSAVAAILSLSFSVLFLYKKMEMFCIFLLTGCTKGTAYRIMAAGLGLIGVLATCAAGAIILLYPRFLEQFGFLYLTPSVMGYLLLYVLLLIVLALLPIILIYRNVSVLSVRKRTEL